MVESVNDVNNHNFKKNDSSSAVVKQGNNAGSIFGNNSGNMPSLIENFDNRTERFNEPEKFLPKAAEPAEKPAPKKKTPARRASNNNVTIFENKSSGTPSLVGDLKQQDEKLNNASKSPAFQMTDEERETAEILNSEHQSRVNHQKKIEAQEKAEKERQRTIRAWAPHIEKLGIDVTGMTAEQIENAVAEGRARYRASHQKGNPIDDYHRMVDEVMEPLVVPSGAKTSYGSNTEFRKATVFGNEDGYAGKISGKDFKLYSRKNSFEGGRQFLGSIGKQRVNVEERRDYGEVGGKKYYGKIGQNDITISSTKGFSDKVEFSGTYNGKNFTVVVKRDFLSARGAQLMKGSFDDKPVEMYAKNGNQETRPNSIPAGFTDVAALLLVVAKEN